jgi:hypothetical protein
MKKAIAFELTDGSPILIEVHDVEVAGESPDSAERGTDRENLESTGLKDWLARRRSASAQGSVRRLSECFNAVRQLADQAMLSLKGLSNKPEHIELTFCVGLEGTIGIPCVTSGSANAGFQVKVSWNRNETPARSQGQS